MLIDWFTVGAQVLNFAVLVWLLQRFLYKPVLGAIDAREKRIAAELSDADARKAAAQIEQDDFKARNKAIDDQREAVMARASADAGAERDRLFKDARAESDARRASREAALQAERKALAGEITQLATTEVFEIARRALADLATVSLEERIGEVFTRRLRSMDPKDREALGFALRTSPEPGVVRSTFDIGVAQRDAIQNALNEVFSARIRVRFETSPEGICGIELTSNGRKLAWSVSGYLSSLERKLDALTVARGEMAGAAGQP
jgi:F-type H+-transporting ATPase subunit b